jgi:hypothetical protein
MRSISNFRLISGAFIVYLLLFSLSACSVTGSKTKKNQRVGLMLQDKSENPKNKKFKKSKAYKSQKKRLKKMGV